MSFSEMTSREKTVVAILGVVILIALVGIGVLAARLLTGDEVAEEAGATVVSTTAPGQTTPGATITTVATPSLEELADTTPAPISSEPVVLAREESPSPLLPVAIMNQRLHADRRYRLEISAADGSKVAIQGSWSQAATGAGGEVGIPQIELFEGTTPFDLELVPPVPDPSVWSVSVSAAPQDLFGQPPSLVIIIYDVTGTE